MMVEDWHTHAQQQYVRSNDAKNSNISLVPHERPWSKCYFLSKNKAPYLSFFVMLLDLKKAKTFFYTIIFEQKLYLPHYIRATTLERFHALLRSLVFNEKLFLWNYQHFLFQELNRFTQKINCFWKNIPNKGNVTWDTFQSFV